MQRWAGRWVAAFDIMAGCQGIGIQFLNGIEQVEEFNVLIARYARDWRFASGIACRKRVDNLGLEAGFVIQDIVRNAQFFGDPTGIVYVLARAATARPAGSLPMIIELQSLCRLRRDPVP